ncbi:hypothetical protein [Acinetobacter guerrae]|uniref:hypothetical protein n=1 Tax=Acinetobacter guerrae TaxID=1843371 RepID=UPI00125F5B74|nr:hypothetical protein [Acinetobacter guerrae]
MKTQSLIAALILTTALSACATHDVHSPSVALQGKCDQKFNYSIQSTRFDETAQQISHATGCFIQTDLSKTADIQTQPVQGEFSPREAIQKAITGTSLKIVQQSANLIVIQ